MRTVLLRIEHLTKRFGGIAAVEDVSFSVQTDEIVGLIGPNGSGKTTLFNCITGFLTPEDSSRVTFLGGDITHHSPDRIARLGMVRTFQELRTFKRMTVLDNLLMSLQQHQEDRVWARFLRTAEVDGFEAKGRARAIDLLRLVGLADYADVPAAALSYGQRKLLTFISALMPDPPLVLLDEPAAAINPVLIDKLKEHIVESNRTGKAFLLIEHNMDVVMDVCHRIVVLDHGRLIAEGTPEVIQNDERVIDAYFGT